MILKRMMYRSCDAMIKLLCPCSQRYVAAVTLHQVFVRTQHPYNVCLALAGERWHVTNWHTPFMTVTKDNSYDYSRTTQTTFTL